MGLSMDQIVARLEQIEQDLLDRQSKGETSAENFYRAKRDYELAYSKALVDATGSATEKKAKAVRSLEKDPAYFALLESEGAYEGWKAVTRTLETRASIGQSLLRAQRETGG